MKTRKNCLLLLGFSSKDNPNQKEIKKQFRQLSVKYHPDKPDGDAIKYRDISIAYECLLENKFIEEEKAILPDNIDEKLIDKISDFLDNCSDKVNVEDKKIIFKLINNNLICIKIETTEKKTIFINNQLIKLV